MPFEISTERFSGPLQKLLELIEERKLEITELSLAKITGEFLDYVSKIGDAEPKALADFVAVASKLLLIKSKSLIPDLELTAEEEESIADLEARLKLYKEFKSAEKNIRLLWGSDRRSFSRDFAAGASRPTFFYPPKNFSTDLMVKAFAGLYNIFAANQKQYVEHKVIDFEKYVADLIGRIKGATFRFKELSKDKERQEIIILFLALLHLLKDNTIRIEQGGQFEEIIISPHA
ncbi:MAG: segregation/condensation protein A [Patescibacteria group bacterium]|nr:segregation/condensation protein A [Patescibacteria group bacterium]MCL5261777.1 segregation/condensation protein A [Patescibacteria group bacterium]